jgi:hypothetical protein
LFNMVNPFIFRVALVALSAVAAVTPVAAQTAAPAPADQRPADAKAPDAKSGEPASPEPASPESTSPANDPLAQFAWLEGCWRGEVNKREFREHWLPPRGALMIGVSHTVLAGKTLDYEYLRIEPRSDGVYYVITPVGTAHKETSYRLADRAMDREDEVFTFASGGEEFPQKILYRHNASGWLYATVAGKINGADKQVIYPMHHVSCETGEAIGK